MTPSRIPLELRILLHDVELGRIVLDDNDSTEFRLSRGYLERVERPVLGQVFEDDLTAVHRSRMRLPPFFANLLPEGRLRELVAGRAEVAPDREFFLLGLLGSDLPGAVRAVPAEGSLTPGDEGSANSAISPRPGPLKFSLAGVQLKLSMVREGRGMTLPASGHGGDWIVKLPGTHYVGVPENEFATMRWAGLAGIQVPEVDLLPMSAVAGLPPGLDAAEGNAFAIRRFDRVERGLRVHIEDFAQVRNQYPDYRGKYLSTNYETLGKLILRIAGTRSFEEFIRRLAFIVVIANADAHIKNWSLIYPDGRHPELSPAYDLVSTIEFIEQDYLALNLARNKDWSEVRLSHFVRLAERIGAEPGTVSEIVRETVTRALDAWPTVRTNLPVSALLIERLEGHWRRLPLLEDVRP